MLSVNAGRAAPRVPLLVVFLLALTAGFYWKLTVSREWTFLESPGGHSLTAETQSYGGTRGEYI